MVANATEKCGDDALRRGRHILLGSARPRSHVFLFCTSAAVAAAVAARGRSPSGKPLSVVEYLVNSWGLSTAEASKAAKSLVRLKSTKKPDAVLNFQKSQGFHGSHLKKIVPLNPRCLRYDVEKVLAPRLRSLHDVGISESDRVEIIAANPCILSFDIHRSLLPKLVMWESLFGSREFLIKQLKKRCCFFAYSIENKLLPNLKFLKDECGIPQERVTLLVRKSPRFLVRKLDSLRTLVCRADELGMPRQSLMFMWALYVPHGIRKESVDAKHKLMMSLGWSDSEFSAAVRKGPSLLCISQEELRRKMEFLVKEARYTPSYIAHQPLLLFFSLEKRVIPRFRVIELLKLKGLWTARSSLLSILTAADDKFIQKFVIPFREKVPELFDILQLAKNGDTNS